MPEHCAKSGADWIPRYPVAFGCVRTIDDGHVVAIGPASAFFTAWAFRNSGTEQIHAPARISAGQVTVSAECGTDPGLSKCPSPACCLRDASSITTFFTVAGSEKSATCGSLNAMCPFSPNPTNAKSSGAWLSSLL